MERKRRSRPRLVVKQLLVRKGLIGCWFVCYVLNIRLEFFCVCWVDGYLIEKYPRRWNAERDRKTSFCLTAIAATPSAREGRRRAQVSAALRYKFNLVRAPLNG